MSALRVIHVLRWFDPATERLVGEEGLRDTTVEELRRVLALEARDPVLNVYPIGDDEARWLQERVAHAIDRDAYVYFVEAQQRLGE